MAEPSDRGGQHRPRARPSRPNGPALETIFSDVYADDARAHPSSQGQAAFDLARRKGGAAAGEAEFPL